MVVPKLLGSSVNPEKLAMTVRGILLLLVPTVIAVARFKGVELGEEGIMQAIDAFIDLIQAVSAVVGSVWLFWGLIRKVQKRFFN